VERELSRTYGGSEWVRWFKTVAKHTVTFLAGEWLEAVVVSGTP
jgi:hypothetical protein